MGQWGRHSCLSIIISRDGMIVVLLNPSICS
nr:MAG TPA: hypothetical protein [Caudoviricetes sp.]